MSGAGGAVNKQVVMEQVELSRFRITGLLGSGADYEVRAAVDQETGKQVVLKRPVPQMVSRRLHGGTESRTDRILEFHQQMDRPIDTLIPIVGYTERAVHDEYYGDSLGQEYRVVVEERARGIPLMVTDMRARITGVPTGVGQNLFSLFPLVWADHQGPFLVHQQLLDTEESFLQSGYLLLDLRPQNLFYQPASGRITIVDCGALVPAHGQPDSRGNPAPDVHDFFLEVLKFYTTPAVPPPQAAGYRDPHGLRPVVNFQQELDEIADSFGETDEAIRTEARQMTSKIKDRSYTDFADFRRDLNACLEAIRVRNENLDDLSQARHAWREALEWLRGDHWQRYLFDADAELEVFDL